MFKIKHLVFVDLKYSKGGLIEAAACIIPTRKNVKNT